MLYHILLYHIGYPHIIKQIRQQPILSIVKTGSITEKPLLHFVELVRWLNF